MYWNQALLTRLHKFYDGAVIILYAKDNGNKCRVTSIVDSVKVLYDVGSTAWQAAAHGGEPMDFKDVSARLKKTRENDQQTELVKPANPVESFRIRGKMVGVLLRDARQNAGRTVEDCARKLQISPEVIEGWEYGDDTPSLPQLELLAFFLDVPVSHFWGTDTLEASVQDYSRVQTEYMALRDRMIGALLRQAREARELTQEELSEISGVSAEQINIYEFGEAPIPMQELTVLANSVKKNINYFLESSSHIGELLTLREEWKHFIELPEEIRLFAANPLNVGFIEIAMMLSQMPTDRLRRIGESVLNITM
jgi:transcriptional regulator with XRE-family HTH domain